MPARHDDRPTAVIADEAHSSQAGDTSKNPANIIELLDGCGRPPSWCEVHHLKEWEHGGETKLSNLAMLCRAHHRQVHSADWIVRIRDGLPEFIPPRWIDDEQRPRRRALPHLASTAT